MKITIQVSEAAASLISDAIAALGSGDASSGVSQLIANAACERARQVQTGIVRVQLPGATAEERASLMQSIREAVASARSTVTNDGEIVVTVE